MSKNSGGTNFEIFPLIYLSIVYLEYSLWLCEFCGKFWQYNKIKFKKTFVVLYNLNIQI